MGNCHVRSLNKPGRMSPKVAVVGLLKETSINVSPSYPFRALEGPPC